MDKQAVERIAQYIESESQCLMPIVVEETKHDYGIRLLRTLAQEIRVRFVNSDNWTPISHRPGYETRINEAGDRETRPIQEEV